jgi:hypothetical protein
MTGLNFIPTSTGKPSLTEAGIGKEELLHILVVWANGITPLVNGVAEATPV